MRAAVRATKIADLPHIHIFIHRKRQTWRNIKMYKLKKNLTNT